MYNYCFVEEMLLSLPQNISQVMYTWKIVKIELDGFHFSNNLIPIILTNVLNLVIIKRHSLLDLRPLNSIRKYQTGLTS